MGGDGFPFLLKVQADMVEGYVFGCIYTGALAKEDKWPDFLLVIKDRFGRKPVDLFSQNIGLETAV